MHIARLPITHPDAVALIEAVQEEYVERYGGRDESPIDPGEFAGDRGEFFVGYVDEIPVASGAWRFRPAPEGIVGRTVEIKRMYVVPTHRGLGLARRMLAHLEATARTAGAEQIILETGLKQPEAIALYRSEGYDEIPGFGYYCGAELSRCFGKSLGLEARR